MPSTRRHRKVQLNYWHNYFPRLFWRRLFGEKFYFLKLQWRENCAICCFLLVWYLHLIKIGSGAVVLATGAKRSNFDDKLIIPKNLQVYAIRNERKCCQFFRLLILQLRLASIIHQPIQVSILNFLTPVTFWMFPQNKIQAEIIPVLFWLWNVCFRTASNDKVTSAFKIELSILNTDRSFHLSVNRAWSLHTISY